ncbi:MAG TPA: ATP-binding protein [Tepidisphaeraceae bacterium]
MTDPRPSDDTANSQDALLAELAELRRQNEALRRVLADPTLDSRLAAIVESSDDAIVSKSLQGIIRTWNKGAERIFGWRAEEVIGEAINLIIPPDRQDEEPQILARLARGERVDHFETVRITKDGRLIDVSVTISPVRDASGTIVGASKIARDITLQKRFQQELRQAKEAADQARAEAERISLMKDEFLATLSHELRTPLNAILGWAQVMQAQAGSNEGLAEGLTVIERNARVQAQLIEDLLDMSRIIAGKIRLDVQQVDLQDVISSAVASVRHAADAKEIRLQVVLDPLAGPVRGDPGRLQQCFWNLLTNAIKFTPKGGKVQVALERVNSHVEVCVADNGQGIRPEFLPYLFERFRQADSTTSRRHGGLGLGLSIVKHLIELHGGDVWAKSPGVGQGATFCIELPVAVVRPAEHASDRQDARGASAGATPDRPSLAGITVLAVDDEPDSRGLVRHVLEACGARVLTAASSAEALQLLSQQRPDMILSDIGMPGEDGYEFLRKVRALPPESGGRTPAAALTAFARSEDRMRALRAGYQTHVAKPVDAAELAAVVASLAMRR